MDDEEDVTGPGGLAALSRDAGSLDDSDKEFARNILRGGSAARATDTAYQSMEAEAEKTRELLRAARQRLLARPVYDERDKYLAIGSAILGGGSSTGRMGEGFARGAEALRKENMLRRELEAKRDTDVLGLDQALLGVDSATGAARRTLAMKREELESRLKGQALAALKGSKGTSVDGVPMNVKQFLFWKNLPTDQDRNDYLNLLRANQVRNIAGVETIVRPDETTKPLTDLPTVAGNEAAIAGAKAGATTAATNDQQAISKALAELPNAINQATELQALIDRVKSHPGLPGGVGLSLSRINEFVPGSPVRDFVELSSQLESNSFVNVVQNIGTMAGLTNIEGEKLQTALVNLSRSQSESQYRQNLGVFERQSKRTLRLLQEKLQSAQAGVAPGRPRPQGASRASGQPSGAQGAPKKRYNKETGKIEEIK